MGARLVAGRGVETGRTRDTSAGAAVPATAHRRFHVEKKQRRGLPVILPETIVRRRYAALIPYARNARTHSDQQVAQIAASIREFGFTNPVLIDEEGIIAGAGRVLAAHLLGLDEVPCIVLAHLTPTQRRAYVLVDNKLALNAGWDLEMLSLEIGELGERSLPRTIAALRGSVAATVLVLANCAVGPDFQQPA